jgi:hypothetical protein
LQIESKIKVITKLGWILDVIAAIIGDQKLMFPMIYRLYRSFSQTEAKYFYHPA